MCSQHARIGVGVFNKVPYTDRILEEAARRRHGFTNMTLVTWGLLRKSLFSQPAVRFPCNSALPLKAE